MTLFSGLANFVGNPAGVIGNSDRASREILRALALPGGEYLIEGLDGESPAILEELFGPWMIQTTDPTRVTRIRCCFGKGFRKTEEIDWSRYMGVEFTPNQILFAGFGWLARIPRDRKTTTDLCLSREISGRNLEDAWENFLRALVACRLIEKNGVLIHGCSVVLRKGAVLFPGISGAGKSTLARMFQKAGLPVLSDDCNAILPAPDGGFLLKGLPFGGDFRPRIAPVDAFPLDAVLIPEKSSIDRIEAVSTARVAGQLIRCAPFVNGDPYIGDRLPDTIEAVLATVRTGRFFFSLSGACVSELESFQHRPE